MPGRCVDCKHWAQPQWDTNGFGRCDVNSAREEERPVLPILIKTGGAQFNTHETFGCILFEGSAA